MPRTPEHTHTDVDCAERPQTMRADGRMSMQLTVDFDNTTLTVPDVHDDREPHPSRGLRARVNSTSAISDASAYARFTST